LDDQEFVQVDTVVDKKTAKKVSIAARLHLRSVLRPKADIRKYDDLLSYALRAENVAAGLTWKPYRSNKDRRTIRKWEKRPPSDRAFLAELENDKANRGLRSITFVARTFLYLGYMNVQQLAFVPDTTRLPLVDKICKRENDLRGSLLETLEKSNREQLQTEPDKIWDTITPLAAVVLSRAATRNDIARKMADLRHEMTDVRANLRKLEEAALGNGARTEQKSALRKWHEINKEISRTYVGGGSLFSRKDILDFSVSALNVALNPVNPANWLKLIAVLPSDAVGRLINRRPVSAIISLKQEIPGSGLLRKRINHLFGDAIKA
jgi:hypothetical protein